MSWYSQGFTLSESCHRIHTLPRKIYFTGELHLWRNKWSGRWSTLIEFCPISFLLPQASLHVSHLCQCCPFCPTWVEKQRPADLHTSWCPPAPCGFGHCLESKKYNLWTWFTFFPPGQMVSDSHCSFSGMTQHWSKTKEKRDICYMLVPCYILFRDL